MAMRLTHISSILHCYQAIALRVQMTTGNIAILPRFALGYSKNMVTNKPTRRLHIYWFRRMWSITLYAFHDKKECADHVLANYANHRRG